MRNRFAKLVLAFLILLPTLLQGQTGQDDWRVLYSEKFNVFFHQKDSLNATAISKILHDEYPSISTELGADVESPIGVFIAASKYQFSQLTGGAIPHWGEAVADPGKQIIIVKSPRWTNSSNGLRVVVVHELVHILVGAAVGRTSVPRWLGEGLAIYFSGEISHVGGSELSHAQISEQLIPLSQIDDMLSFGQPKAHLAYQEAYLAVVYIIETYGQSAIHVLLDELQKNHNINTAVREAFGITLIQFEYEWRQSLLEKYKWSFLIEFDKYLWVFIILLFFLAILAMYIRRRRTLARWEAESIDSSPTS